LRSGGRKPIVVGDDGGCKHFVGWKNRTGRSETRDEEMLTINGVV
jgi:hypothetical protein